MKEIKAKDGYWFTQKWEINEENRIFTSTITGLKATTDYWVEVSNDYKIEWENNYLPKDDEQEATFEAHNAQVDAEMEAEMNKELEVEQ